MPGPPSFEAYWPTWPQGVQGTKLVDIRPKCAFEELVDHLWAPGSKFQEDANHARGMTDCVSTAWVEDINLLPCLPGGYNWNVETADHDMNESPDCFYAGLMRKVRFAQGGVAVCSQPFKGEELQRCVEYCHGEVMTVEACVSNSAPMCENMRVVVRYNLQSLGRKCTQLRVEYHVIYVSPTNGLLKVVLEKGAKGGLLKNFEIYVQILSNFAPLESGNEEEEAGDISRLCPSSNAKFPAAQVEARHSVAGLNMQPIAASPISWSRLAPRDLASVLCVPICSALQRLERLEPFERAKEHLAMERFRHQDGQILSQMLACVMLLVLLKIWILVLRSVHTVCDGFLVLRPFCGSGSILAADIPDGLQEVLAAMAMVQIAHWFLGALARSYRNTHARARGSWESQADSADGGAIEGQSYLSRIVSCSRLAVVTGALTLEAMSNPGIGTIPKHKGRPHKPRRSVEFEAPEVHEQQATGHQEEPVELKEIDRVVEEIFENERCMPFRGWGHTPPHFLRTDRLRHWSLRSLAPSSMEFSDVEPVLPEGWCWEEPEWEVDMNGRDSQAVDEDGWMYAVQFSGLVFPPSPGNGKKTAATFVRRRRWIRTRTRTESMGTPSKAERGSFAAGAEAEAEGGALSPAKDAPSKTESLPRLCKKGNRDRAGSFKPAHFWDGELWSANFWCGGPKGRHKGTLSAGSAKEIVSGAADCPTFDRRKREYHH
ncbi:unnamed protein product [Ostreobium quekettii]|uniref:Peroxin/Ferlin domain-containing protein n=1 Tax=Ostreobium quekettii TaxID=121088 RepID=A0A8S1IXH6_9CHLO|nr:unnamed protein product [Ostreobium quekettii]